MKIEDYEGELREKIDVLAEGIYKVQDAIEILNKKKIFKDLALDLQDDLLGWEDYLENLENELQEIENEKYENEKKEREREYNSFRL